MTNRRTARRPRPLPRLRPLAAASPGRPPLRPLAAALLGTLLLAAPAACTKEGSNGVTNNDNPGNISRSTSVNTISPAAAAAPGNAGAARTAFIQHAGLAAGAASQFVVEPYRAGAYAPGAKGRVATLIKGGLAGAFAYHQLQLAAQDTGSDPALAPLAAPVTAAEGSVQAIAADFKNTDTAAPADIDALDSALTALRTAAEHNGASFVMTTPSLFQLIAGTSS